MFHTSNSGRSAWNSSIMNEVLYQKIHERVVASGQRALKNKDITPVHTKEDGSVYTDMDVEIGDTLSRYLREKTGVPVICEEDEPALMREEIEKARKTGTYWTLDPIDGTSSYVRRGTKANPKWGVMLGLVEDGEPVFAMNYYPELSKGGPGTGLVVSTHAGRVVYEEMDSAGHAISGRPGQPFVHGDILPRLKPFTPKQAIRDRLVATGNAHMVKRELGAGPDMKKRASPNYIQSFRYPSTLHILEGTAMLGGHSSGAKIWDTVPYAAFIKTAGLAQVPADGSLRNAEGTTNYSKIPDGENGPSYGPMWEGHPDTLKALGLMPQKQIGRAGR